MPIMSIQELLDRSRKELLDLSTRNRLLSIPVGSKSARIIEVRDELSDQIYKLLVTEKKSLCFLPGRVTPKSPDSTPNVEEQPQEEEDEISLPQPEDDEIDEATGLAKRHVDFKLQTALTSEGLQRRLLALYYNAITMLEEQGVNILYLALGHLKWFEVNHSDIPRYAPLILVPVELQRKSASERFRIRWREEDIQENLSLQAKLKVDFGVDLPFFPDEEEFNPTVYFEQVQKAVNGLKDWEVLPNGMTLGFFSFAKFLMYRDLDPVNWPIPDLLLKNPFITSLLQDGFPRSESLFPADANLDDLIPASRLDHVVNADSSQTLAIETVRKGRSVVIQGPPGTGKSQSITNVISTAVLDGKRVLFIAEKLAALEVVKRRLEAEGLGPLCLELHSNKSNKRSVIEEIGRTWKLGRPKSSDVDALAKKLEKKRAYLNKHVSLLHKYHLPSGIKPFTMIGKLSLLGDQYREVAGLTFSDAENWDRETCSECRSLIKEISERVEEIGLPCNHPWRGVCKDVVLSIDLNPLAAKIQTVLSELKETEEIYLCIAQNINQPIPATLQEIGYLLHIAEYVAKAPIIDKKALCNNIWCSGLENLLCLLKEGQNYERILQDIGDQVKENIWDADFSVARATIAKHGRSIFRLFYPKYRESGNYVKSFLVKKIPSKYIERLTLLDKIIFGQKSLLALRHQESQGKSAFGSLWNNEKTKWNQIADVLDWVTKKCDVGLTDDFFQVFTNVQEKQVAQWVEQLTVRLETTRQAIVDLFQDLNLEYAVALGVDSIENLPLEILAERCSIWLSRMEDLSRWTNYYIRARRARELGLKEFLEKIEKGEVSSRDALNAFDRIYFEQLFRAVIHQQPELAQFDGVLHDTHVNEFRKLDEERILLAKYCTLIKHHDGMPDSNAGIGESGIVKSEMERKRGHRSVRRLLKDAGSVVQAIKPVFMMSPLSVAQFLEPGSVEFDLLVIDEASQVQPVDAFGAITRCKQIVVVGDSKQLPPTRFFTRLTTESSEEEQEGQIAEAKDIESILGLCCARGLPETMLEWHYRSRHHSLIAVSNHEFYNDRLFIVPSPYSMTEGLGLKFHHIPDGVFDSGASGTNRIEAKAICKAIIEHARKNPGESLGVAAFSIKQQEAILDELEFLRRECPDTEEFFASHPTEPFFVKNLENVQGDERDVIFISVGYARNADGFMAMRFGPLSSEGGERRLNVLISRAKNRCEIFASITAEDIDLQRASGKGVAAFKTFLCFAQTGRFGVARESGREEQSPFEESVRKAIENLGYEVHPQVGVAGFFIDLGVLDKDRSGRYLIGIECDGASYHSARSARDRDRLRQAVLEDHGWIIHRIWSVDWFQRPQEQLRKVAEAIERAKIALAEVKHDDKPEVTLTVEIDGEEEILRESTNTESDKEGFGGLACEYKEANFKVPWRIEPHEVSKKEMADIIFRIVEQEGPIHEDEIVVRVKNLWGLGRAGNRIQDAVGIGIRFLLASQKCKREEGFLIIPGQKVLVRKRQHVFSPSLRKPAMLPPMEIRAAIQAIIQEYHGSSRSELPSAIARLFGFKSTSAAIRHIIEKQVDDLLKKNKIEEVNGMLRCANES